MACRNCTHLQAGQRSRIRRAASLSPAFQPTTQHVTQQRRRQGKESPACRELLSVGQNQQQVGSLEQRFFSVHGGQASNLLPLHPACNNTKMQSTPKYDGHSSFLFPRRENDSFYIFFLSSQRHAVLQLHLQ